MAPDQHNMIGKSYAATRAQLTNDLKQKQKFDIMTYLSIAIKAMDELINVRSYKVKKKASYDAKDEATFVKKSEQYF